MFIFLCRLNYENRVYKIRKVKERRLQLSIWLFRFYIKCCILRVLNFVISVPTNWKRGPCTWDNMVPRIKPIRLTKQMVDNHLFRNQTKTNKFWHGWKHSVDLQHILRLVMLTDWHWNCIKSSAFPRVHLCSVDIIVYFT